MSNLRKTKNSTEVRFGHNTSNLIWQGWQFGNQTPTDEELEKVDVDEIRELFDPGSG
ncbi:MAG TPA: hypothetical protein VLA77_03510 [Candidatus Saccharimonadales bacterium]|nr:hypothetical protein [Candidatus Saccharimonadales bacterium]